MDRSTAANSVSMPFVGREQLVLDMRKAYQSTMRHDLISGVEEITGRKVIAFLSDHHIDPDIAIESFVLEPGLEADITQPPPARR